MSETELRLITYKLLEKLINRKEEIEKKKDYYEQINNKSKELEKIKYQLMLTNSKIKMVEEIKTLPLYARYHAMSDIELEDYKKRQTIIINCKIDSLTYKINSTRNRILELKTEQDDMSSKYLAVNNNVEKAELIKKGKEIDKAIEEFNKLIKDYNKEQQEKVKERDIFERKTYEEIKTELEKSSNFNVSKISRMNISDTLIKAMASIADNYDNAQKLSDLLYDYNKYSSYIPTVTVEGFYTSIRNLDDSLTGGRFPRFKTNDCTRTELNEMYNYIQGLESRIEGKEAIFNRIFKKDKFLKLMDAKDKKINIDENFITYFKDELPYEQTIFNLKILVNTKENKEQELNKNRFIFNKHKIYTDISGIDKRINDLKEEIINNIIAFYMKESNNLNLGELSFKNLNSAIKYLNDGQNYFDEQKDCLNNTLRLLTNKSKDLTEIEQIIKQKLANIKEQIKELTNVEVDDKDLNINDISCLEIIAEASAIDHRSTLINIIIATAKDLAVIKEEELLKQRGDNGYQKKK